MSVGTVILAWWLLVVFTTPFLILFFGPVVARKLSSRKRYLYSSPFFVVLGLCFTPISLSGIIADHIVLGGSVTALCLLISGPKSRMIGFMSIGLVVFIAVVSLGTRFGFLSGLIAGDIAQVPTRSIELNSGRIVNVRPVGLVTHGGEEVSVIRRMPVLPLEIELGRKTFWDNNCASGVIDAHDETNGHSTIITCDGIDGWRVD
ncbi:MAG: hypothetical protein OEW15_12925 [Nitrospirota bacterium]|nr:hypothetical protein [Nitrospirota bacterium]